MRDLNEGDLERLGVAGLSDSPAEIKEAVLGSRFVAIDEAGDPTTLWLWIRQKRTCWYYKALHEYEAWVTIGEAADSPKYPVEELAIHIDRNVDHATYWHAGQNVEYWAKSDIIYNYGGACGRSACFARAKHWGGLTWSTNTSVIE